MIKLLFNFFIFFILYGNFNITLSSVISENKNEYTIKSVRVEGASFEDLQSSKQIALKNAKQKAFNDLMNFLKKEDIQIDEINIDTTIKSYSIVDEYYNENFYSLVANFSLDKNIVKSLIKKNEFDNLNKGEVGEYVVVLKEQNDIVKEYVKFRDYLKSEKVTFFPVEISSKYIKVNLKNVVEEKIYNSLKEIGVNGSIYKD